MRQEDYNDMMKTPEESLQLRQSNISKKLPECPICKSEYLGDGVAPCVECGLSCLDGSEEAEFIGWHGLCAECELKEVE